ncbi:MAG TPA: histone deacetylase family protein [Allosphingosinicella sp.]|nr:histone deacetylase family protein [Allosphingosinicella sp.]
MRCFFDPRQLAHAPTMELHNGGFVPYAETPARAEAVLAALGPVEGAVDHGEAPLRAVHDEAYLAFLWSAHKDWRAAGRAGDASGYAWPIVRRRPLALDRIDAKLGAYSFDASSPIAEGTWGGAYWSAQTALTALDAVLVGERAAFALCRPPGHHAGRDYLGGYCHLNNAAIAAEAATTAGRRVAILDVDYHHGNGTQDLFYERGDVFFASIHADPRTDYPYFWGHADERGEGAGEGATLNLPLPRGAGLAEYLPALERALAAIAGFGADLLVISYGADTWAGDPISFFKLETPDYAVMAARIASLGLPGLVVMEGGYAVDALGPNVAAFLEGLA